MTCKKLGGQCRGGKNLLSKKLAAWGLLVQIPHILGEFLE